MIKRTVYAILIILVPTYLTAYLTDKMIYVIPMLAVCTIIVAQLHSSQQKRVDDDGGNITDIGSRKDEG